LSVGDQKGLLTACHTQDLANSWGDRFGDGEGSGDPQDLRPDLLWRLLKLHLGQRGVPLVLDVEAGAEVWNYPIYQYELRYYPISGAGEAGRDAPNRQANLTLLMADDAVPPGYRGTKVRKQTYQFTFQLRHGNVVAGSGHWVGRSREDHPDFAWYPYKAVAANPEVKYPKVRQLVTADQTSPPTPEPTLPVAPGESPAHPPNTTPSTPPVQPSPSPAEHPSAPVTTPSTQATGPVVLSPIELTALIANKTSSFEFDVSIDRFDGASYRSGETFVVRVKSQRAGYLYLLQVDSAGTPALLFPTAGEDNRIPAGQLLDIKPRNADGGFPVAGPVGIVRVKAVVTSRPLAFSGSLELLQTQQQAAPSQRAQQSQTQAVPFRWHPTQQRQIKKLLAQSQIRTTPEQLECRSPQDILGPFAQDMTTFYIDTQGNTESRDTGRGQPVTDKRKRQ